MPPSSNTYLIKPSMKRTAGCLTILAAARAAKLVHIKASDS
jgi:hypothetical protein